MVGRVACPLSEEDLVRACTFRRSGFENEMVKEVKEESCQRRESEESGFGEEKHSESANVKEEGGTSQRQGSDELLWTNEDDSDMCESEAESSIPVSHLNALFDDSFMFEASIPGGAQEEDSTFEDGSRNVDPIWMDPGRSYSPSPNIPPGRYTPVLFWKRDVGPVVQPMHWGIEDNSDYYNARLEGVETNQRYGPHLKERRRCIIICEGFFVWRKEDKQPFFLYRKGEAEKREGYELKQSRGGGEDFEGPLPLFMAGIYSVSPGAGGDIYSFAVLTRRADPNVSRLHERYSSKPMIHLQIYFKTMYSPGCHVSSPTPSCTPG